MAYTLPTFNLAVNIWRQVNFVFPYPVADVITVGNLTPGRRVVQIANIPLMFEFLLLPALTDVRCAAMGPTGLDDMIECPAGSGRYYEVYYVMDVAKGFANEHRMACIFALGVLWTEPYP